MSAVHVSLVELEAFVRRKHGGPSFYFCSACLYSFAGSAIGANYQGSYVNCRCQPREGKHRLFPDQGAARSTYVLGGWDALSELAAGLLTEEP